MEGKKVSDSVNQKKKHFFLKSVNKISYEAYFLKGRNRQQKANK